MPTDKERRAQLANQALPRPKPTSTLTEAGSSHSGGAGCSYLSSGQVSWWSVHEHVEPILAAVGSWPMVGTPAWCAMENRDLRKLAALFDAAQHHALRVETCQERICEASRDISAAEDWRATAQKLINRRTAYIPRGMT
jgi:Protein of unknown function (DUF2742)